MNEDATVHAPVLKIFSAWLVALGFKSWGDIASFLAACYTLLLIGEWLYKKFIKKGRRP